jgi:putative MATE family efflux protein
MTPLQLEKGGMDSTGLWAALREAIRGSRRDYTEGPIGRALLILAVPMVVEMIMESVFAVVDIFWVSHLGADAVAAVGLTESMLAIIYTIAMGLSIGVTAMVARRIGEKDPEQAARTAVQGIALGVGFSLVLGILGLTFAPRLLVVMGASPQVVALGSGYTTTMLGGNATILLLFLINATFRGAGDAAIAMRALWLANWINIILGPCFIFGLGPFPELGVTGAAVATNIGRGTGVIFQLYNLTKGGAHLAVRKRHLALDPGLMVRLLRLSGTGTFQVLVGTASWIGLIRILASFGSAALAGYTIGIRLIIFALLPSWGLSNAAATMVGQGLGAKKPERAERAVWLAGLYNMVVLSAVGAVFAILAGPIVSLFTHDPAVVPYGVSCLRLVSLGFPFYAYGMVLTQAFNGAGDTWTPTWLNLVVFWLWEIPLAFFLARQLEWGPTGVFLAITAAFSTLAIASAVLFRRGRWKLRMV